MAKLIASMLNHPSSWTKNALGRRADGSSVNNFDVLFTSNPRTGIYEENDPLKDVKSFSLYGALAACYPPDKHEQVLDKLRSAIERYTGKADYVAQFNDRPETTHKEVLTIARIANV